MRTLVLPLLMAALSATAAKPEKMFVVIHTTDKVIVNYVCSDELYDDIDLPVVGTYVRSTGGYDWHVVGGVAPYTIVKNDMRTMSSGCITVMDAEGTVATSCGIIGVRQERRPISCGEDGALLDGPYGLVPNDSTDKARSAWKNQPQEQAIAPSVNPGVTYVPPVKGPLPTVDPPVGPKPVITTRPERRTPNTNRRPYNPPPVDRRSVMPSMKSPEGASGHGPSSLSKHPDRTPGNNAVQQRLSEPGKVR